MRKKRNDRTHIIYELVYEDLNYVGITAKTFSTINKSVWSRYQKHCRRARTENMNWPLYEAMRRFGPENFKVFILETVRGKAIAHKRELELISEIKPNLNLASNKKG